jgi:DNA polymerase III delta prime subunit
MGLLERLIEKLAIAERLQAEAEADLAKLQAQEAQAEAEHQRAVAALQAAQAAERAHRRTEDEAWKSLLAEEVEIDARLRDLRKRP